MINLSQQEYTARLTCLCVMASANCSDCDCAVFYQTNNSSNCTFSELFPAHINTPRLRPDLPSQVKLLSPRHLQSLFQGRNL